MSGKSGEHSKALLDAADKLSKAVRFKTISYNDISQFDTVAFKGLHAFLEESYPLVHEKMKKEIVGEYSLLYKLEGTDPGAKPIVFCAHIDVVPVDELTAGDWTHPPFEGRIADGFVWGRGTMDCKHQVIALMEALETLLSEGFTSRRTMYFAFGQDEEMSGWTGASKIAALLKSRGLDAEYVMDEGGTLIDGEALNMKKPVAMIGITEKGYLSVELKAVSEGGHSSMPPQHTTIGTIARAIQKIESNPFPAKTETTTRLMFKFLGPDLPLPMRILAAAPEIAGMAVGLGLLKDKALNAMFRTTAAATIVTGGTKDNILPQETKAIVNLRLLPGDTIDYAVKRLKKVINDPSVTVTVIDRPDEASKTSDIKSTGFKILTKTMKEVMPEAAPAPFLMLGMTDARHYTVISDSVYRFCPLYVGNEDRDRVHGTNERIEIGNFRRIISFYKQMMLNSQ